MDKTRQTVIGRVLAITAASMVTSLALTLLVRYFYHGGLAGSGLSALIAALVPLLIAPIGSWREISLTQRLRIANERLKTLSETDPLTQTLNRRRFLEIAQQQLALAARHCYPTSLLLIDFDHFKLINDRHGHAVGDQVLVESTALIKEMCRESDALARFGGEEFILLLPHTAREGAKMVADRIMQTLRDHIVHDPASGLPMRLSVTVSIGGVTSEASESALDVMMSRADALLYDAKQAGRDHYLIDVLPRHPVLPLMVSSAS